MGVPPSSLDGLFHGKAHLEMDENWGYPYDLGNHHISTSTPSIGWVSGQAPPRSQHQAALLGSRLDTVRLQHRLPPGGTLFDALCVSANAEFTPYICYNIMYLTYLFEVLNQWMEVFSRSKTNPRKRNPGRFFTTDGIAADLVVTARCLYTSLPDVEFHPSKRGRVIKKEFREYGLPFLWRLIFLLLFVKVQVNLDRFDLFKGLLLCRESALQDGGWFHFDLQSEIFNEIIHEFLDFFSPASTAARMGFVTSSSKTSNCRMPSGRFNAFVSCFMIEGICQYLPGVGIVPPADINIFVPFRKGLPGPLGKHDSAENLLWSGREVIPLCQSHSKIRQFCACRNRLVRGFLKAITWLNSVTQSHVVSLLLVNTQFCWRDHHFWLVKSTCFWSF